MAKENTISRRDFIEALAAVGAVGLSACEITRAWAIGNERCCDASS